MCLNHYRPPRPKQKGICSNAPNVIEQNYFFFFSGAVLPWPLLIFFNGVFVSLIAFFKK